MALGIPFETPKTESQLDILANIGAMRNILALPSLNLKNIPKSQQISTYDFLFDLFDAMGVSAEAELNKFMTKMFGSGTTFLETHVFNSVASALGHNGVLIRPFTVVTHPTAAQQLSYTMQNTSYINGIVGATVDNVTVFIDHAFLTPLKQEIVKNLMIMIFGPRNGASTSLLNPNQGSSINPAPGTVNFLVQNAVCGEGLYGISNAPNSTNQTIEANRILLKQQLEAGQVQYTISCQDVKIKMPQNPLFIFNGGGTFTTSTTLPTPDQSLQFVVQYVNNEVQRINNQTNAAKGGKSFQQLLIEKILSYISVLIMPYMKIVFDGVNASNSPNFIDQTQYIFDNCSIAANPSNTNASQFTQSLFDLIYKELIKVLLLFAIKEFKIFVSQYYDRLLLEKQRRFVAKEQKQFEVFSKFLGNALNTASKIQKYEAAMSTLNSILK